MNRLTRRSMTILALALLGLPASARAQGDAPGFSPTAEAGGGFGAVGQLALSMGPTSGEHFFVHKNGGNWVFQLAPAADYFLAPHVSVGGVVAYTHATGGVGTGANASGSDAFRIVARAGYDFAVQDRFTIWPLGGLELDFFSANHTSSTATSLVVYVPVLFHPAPHFFAGLGPLLSVGLSGGGGNTIGIDSMLGGWL
jgi:hypothetical protein